MYLIYFFGWRNEQGKLNFTSYVVRKGRAFVHHFPITGCLWFGIKILRWEASLYLSTGNFLYKYNTRRSFIYSDNVLKLVRTQNPKPFRWTFHIFCSVKSISLSCSLWSGCFLCMSVLGTGSQKWMLMYFIMKNFNPILLDIISSEKCVLGGLEFPFQRQIVFCLESLNVIPRCTVQCFPWT